MADESVIPLFALEQIVAAEGQQGVVALAPNEHVIADAAQDYVPAVKAEQLRQQVVFLRYYVSAQQGVVAVVARKEVASGLPNEQVVGIIAPQKIVAGPANQLVYTVTAQQVIVPRPTENQVVAGTCTKNVVPALAVYAVVAGAPQDNIVPVRAYQDVVSGPPYQGGKGAQSIDVLLLVHVVLGHITRRAQIVIQPIAGGGFILGISLPYRRRYAGPGLAGIPHQDGGSDQENGADEQRNSSEVSR